MNDKIYMLGGVYHDYEAWVYTISTNTWDEMYDSSLRHSSHDGACTILYESRTKTRRLILVGGYNEYAQYNRIDSNSYWSSMTEPLSYVREATISFHFFIIFFEQNAEKRELKCDSCATGSCRL